MNEKNKLKQQIIRLEGDLLDLDSRMSRMLDRLEYLERKVDETEKKKPYTYTIDETITSGYDYTD
jgi:CII-binding regulator of phage lambda lysogenization HflD